MGSAPVNIRLVGFLTLATSTIFNCNIRLFWHVPSAVCAVKQAVVGERVRQYSGIYENWMGNFAEG
jgi:hypothetical protein